MLDIRKEVLAEIKRLQKVLTLLGEDRSETTKTSGKRKMSAAGRRRISEAQKARWAKLRKS